jgi:hypothetical protein
MGTPSEKEATAQNLRLIKAFSRIASSSFREQIIAVVSECAAKQNISSPRLGASDMPTSLYLVRSTKPVGLDN